MNLKFIHVHEQTAVTFLDVTFEGNYVRGFAISPCRDSTATGSGLVASSCHPVRVTGGLPVGELVRSHVFSNGWNLQERTFELGSKVDI